MGQRKRRWLVALAPVFMVSALFLGAGTASAQTIPPGPAAPGAAPPAVVAAPNACTGFSGPTYYAEYGGWSTSYVYATGCGPVTITNVSKTGYYAGYYYNGSRWVEGTRGYIYLTAGNHSTVMLSGVIAGTAVKINGSVYNSQVTFYY
jgi:hypothetical protein